MKKNIAQKTQQDFFDADAQVDRDIKKDCFYEYSIKEAIEGFQWLADKDSVLDYGCGTGFTLDLYLNTTKKYQNTICGVDISGGAIQRITKRFLGNNFNFFKIPENKIDCVKDKSIESCYLLHVLHHSTNHADIFAEINKKLIHGGKFFICDLTSDNPFINLGRAMFSFLPAFVKNKFSDDLVIDGSIPDKYKVDVNAVVKQLQDAGFGIEKVGFGHLFAFIFSWFDKFFHIAKLPFFNRVFAKISSLETKLLQKRFFQKRASLFYIKCVKTHEI